MSNVDEPVFQNYKGLTSFVDPFLFDKYIGDVANYIESYFPCLIVPMSSSIAHAFFIQAIDHFRSGHHFSVWLNIAEYSVRSKMKFAVHSDITEDHHQFRYVETIKSHPSGVISVCFAIAALRAEQSVPIEKCQISMDNIVEIVERLCFHMDYWLFDQTDLLGMCGSHVNV